MKRVNFFIVWLAIALGAAGVLWWAFSSGSSNIGLGRLFAPENAAIARLRCLRITMACVAGMGLSVCGLLMQACLRNALAEPYILGVSGGASLGALVGMWLGLSWSLMPLAAFFGGALAIALVFAIAYQHGRIIGQNLILAGVIVGMAASSLVTCLSTLLAERDIFGVTRWLYGGLQVFDTGLLVLSACVVFAATGFSCIFRRELDVISLGEEEALHAGVNAPALVVIIFGVASLVTGVLVSVCGIIGFVGLVVPHAVRCVVGPAHARLVPIAAIAGGVFLLICDTLARTIAYPVEMPVGVVTALIGAPVFVILLKAQQRMR